MSLQFKQFALTRTPTIPVVGWRQVDLGGYFLSAPSSVPLTRVLNHGVEIAVLVGWAATDQKLFFDDGSTELPPGVTVADFRELLCGRFLLIAREPTGEVCLSMDGAGLFPVVFDPDKQIAASSPAVIRLFGGLDIDGATEKGVSRSDGTIWYPFGLTPYSGLRRLLPSQQLSIGPKHFKPSVARPLTKLDGPPPSASDICQLVANYIKVFASEDRLSAHLTAGFDSRMVMAAVKRAGISAGYLTIKGPGSSANLDVYIARRLAHRLSANHQVIQFKPPSETELIAWQERVGYCIKDAVMDLCATVEKYDDGALTLTGACGEVGRAFYWTEGDLGTHGLEPSRLIRRLGFLETKFLLEEADQWLANFPPGSRTTHILDNAYIDLRSACWAGSSMPGHLISRPTISPFNSVRVYRAMLALDERYRYRQDFPVDFVRAGNAKLLEERFNAASGMGRLLFIKQDLKKLIPKSVKTAVKGLVQH